MRLNYSVYCCLTGCTHAKCGPFRQQQIANKGVCFSISPIVLPISTSAALIFQGSTSRVREAIQSRDDRYPMFIKQHCFLIIVIMCHQEGRLFLLTLFDISSLDDKRERKERRGRLSAQRARRKRVTLFLRRSVALLIILSSASGLSEPGAEPVRATPVMEGPLAPRCSLPHTAALRLRFLPLPMPLRVATTPAVSFILMHSE